MRFITYGLLAAEDILVGTGARGAEVVCGLTGNGATGFWYDGGGCSTDLEGGAVSLGLTSWYVGGGVGVVFWSETLGVLVSLLLL